MGLFFIDLFFLYKLGKILIKKTNKKKVKKSTNKVLWQETLGDIHLGLIQTASTLGFVNTEWCKTLIKNKSINEDEFQQIIKPQKVKVIISKKDIKIANKKGKV